ncbi:MAG: hypothetical protein C0480_02915 [Bradyrhizobium sp.]|nr:hypothetical protein [Bradyrhizobium sp.]
MKMLRTIELTHAVQIDGRGHRSYEFDLRLSDRDHFLREAARLHCAGTSDRAAADFLRTKLSRYRAGAWRRTASELRSPHPPEKIETLLWSILRCRDMVPGDRLVRDVLARDRY